MPGTLLPVAVRESAESLGRVLSREDGAALAPEELEGLVGLALPCAPLLRKCYDRLKAVMKVGVEERAARREVGILHEAISAWLGLSARLQRAGTESVGASGLPELSAEAHYLREVVAGLEGLIQFMDAPRPPVDPAVFAEAQADYAAGRYRDLAEVVAERRARRAE